MPHRRQRFATYCNDHPFIAFLVLSVLAFVAATLGSDTIAGTKLGGLSFIDAVSQHVYFAVRQADGTAMLFAPFLLLGGMAALLARRRGFSRGLVLFGIGVLLLGWLYFTGFRNAQIYLNTEAWTAGALSIGLLPFKSIPILILCAVAWGVMTRVLAARS